MTEGEMFEIKILLLEFVQDMKTRVSIFLREELQDAYGRIQIPTNEEVPEGKCE